MSNRDLWLGGVLLVVAVAAEALLFVNPALLT